MSSEREHFYRPLNIDLNAASLGVYHEDWFGHHPGMSRKEVEQTMIRRKYDVVPIRNKQGAVAQYFYWDARVGKAVIKPIAATDKMYYLTHITDVIWQMQQHRRNFYFLTNQRGSEDIIGLITLSNLNCREFQVYLFSLISYVERGFAGLIESNSDAAMQVLESASHTEELKNQLREVQRRMALDLRNNIANDYREYLYLHHLIWIARAEKKHELLGYKGPRDFESGTASLKDLRNMIAHPVRSIVRGASDLATLDTALYKLHEFKSRLERHSLSGIKN